MKLFAGPTPAGTYISRKTDNPYAYAVATIDQAEKYWAPRNPAADEFGYIPNPTKGQYVSVSWHRSYALAAKKVDQLRNPGRLSVVIVPVIEGKPPVQS